MTRRVDRMVEEGLVERTTSAADGRGVVIALSEAGLARLMEAVPVHAKGVPRVVIALSEAALARLIEAVPVQVKGVSRLFIERFDDQELEFLQRALEKVTL